MNEAQQAQQERLAALLAGLYRLALECGFVFQDGRWIAPGLRAGAEARRVPPLAPSVSARSSGGGCYV
jgi:hypothetical protein